MCSLSVVGLYNRRKCAVFFDVKFFERVFEFLHRQCDAVDDYGCSRVFQVGLFKSVFNRRRRRDHNFFHIYVVADAYFDDGVHISLLLVYRDVFDDSFFVIFQVFCFLQNLRFEFFEFFCANHTNIFKSVFSLIHLYRSFETLGELYITVCAYFVKDDSVFRYGAFTFFVKLCKVVYVAFFVFKTECVRFVFNQLLQVLCFDLCCYGICTIYYFCFHLC